VLVCLPSSAQRVVFLTGRAIPYCATDRADLAGPVTYLAGCETTKSASCEGFPLAAPPQMSMVQPSPVAAVPTESKGRIIHGGPFRSGCTRVHQDRQVLCQESLCTANNSQQPGVSQLRLHSGFMLLSTSQGPAMATNDLAAADDKCQHPGTALADRLSVSVRVQVLFSCPALINWQ